MKKDDDEEVRMMIVNLIETSNLFAAFSMESMLRLRNREGVGMAHLQQKYIGGKATFAPKSRQTRL